MKKLISTFMAMVMVLMISVPVSATDNGTITITNDSKVTGVSMVDHTYEAYKIMDVRIKVDSNDKQIYEYSVTNTPFKEFFIQMQKKKNEDGDLDLWATNFVRNTDLNELSKDLKTFIETNNIQPTKSEKATGESVTINSLPLGYYLVLDKGTSATSGSATVIASAALGTTNKDLVIKLKASAPTIEKDIYHNDSQGIGNVGDNAIGDTVHFRLLAKIPSNLTGYETYKYIIHDTMSEGLTFNGKSDFRGIFLSTSGTAKDRIEEEYYTLTTPMEHTDGTKEKHTFDLELNVLKATEDYAADEAKGIPELERRGFPMGAKLEIFYDATVNKDAVIAPLPNTNEAYIEYSNDPSDNESTTTTPEDIVKDYTFELNVLKTGEDGKTPLAGAQFKLSVDYGTNQKKTIYYKKASEDEQGNPLPYIEEEDGTRVYYVCNENHTHINNFDTIVTNDSGKFRVVGLDDTYDYTITETEAPEGYTPIEPINFKFKVIYDENGDIKDVEVISDKDVIGVEKPTFALNTTIVNSTGNKLPETGGIGTTIFKVVGITLMVSAAVGIVIARKKGPKNA